MKVTNYGEPRYYYGTSAANAGRGADQRASFGRGAGAFSEAGVGRGGGEVTSGALFSGGVRIYDPVKPGYSTGEKLAMDFQYEQELEDARVNDPEKYEKMVQQRKADIGKTFRQLEEEAGKSTGASRGGAVYNGVNIAFNFDDGIMTVGDMSSGRIINVGRLSNGYCFSFNRENIDQVVAILDLFSPEDINKIMEAITMDNMALSMEAEIEETEDSVPETGAENRGNEGVLSGEKRDDEVRTGEMKEDKTAPSDLKDLKIFGGGGGDGGGEETTTSSEVVVAPDGSRTLVITVKTGGQEIVTKVQLSPPKHEEDGFSPKIDAADGEGAFSPKNSAPGEEYTGWRNKLAGAESAVAAYAANFLYASGGKNA